MDTIIIIWLVLVGAIMGSFLGCMGYRIPNKIKTTYPSSFCCFCKKPLKWYMNIPIFSYIIQGGKCAYCKKKIGSIYFICEVVGAIMFAVNYILFKFNMEFFIATVLTCVLIVTLVSDFEYYYISDRVLVLSVIALITIYFIFDKSNLLMRIVSAIVLFCLMYAIKLFGNVIFKRESLGDGDIKLMGVIGLSLGFLNSFVSLFFASVTGLIFSLITLKKNKEGIIPFGPFLIIGALLVLYFSNIITPFIYGVFNI